MKRFLSIICVGLMLIQLLPVSVLAEGGAMRVLQLPAGLIYVDVNAFQGDASIASVVIPAGVTDVRTGAFENCVGLESIAIEGGSQAVFWENAFQDCTNLKQFVVGPDSDIVLEDHVFAGCAGAFDFYVSRGARVYFNENALENCGEITFHTYEGTEVDLYARSHGYVTETLESTSAIEQARSIIAAYGVQPSLLLSNDMYETMRLIIRTRDNHLPDISGYEPVSIVHKNDYTYLVQFTSSINAEECCQYVRELGERAEPDRMMSFNLPFIPHEEELSAAGVTDESVWGDDDPMGFDDYSEYIKEVAAEGDTVVIALLDSGVTRGNGYDDILLMDKGANFASDGGFDDWDKVYNDHGSAVASVIRSCVGNAKDHVRILPIRVEEATKMIDPWSLVDAIEYAIDNGADIINLSGHLKMPCEYVDDALDRAIAADIRIVAAAGDDNETIEEVYPANHPGTIVAAGIDPDYRLSALTASGIGISYAAPCEWITHALSSGNSIGTSYAVPQIATALALVKLDPHHDVDDMNAACRTIAPKGDGTGAGHGMPQLDRLATIFTTGVQLDENTPTIMNEGSTHALKWTVTPKKATDKTVTVTPSDPGTVAVDATDGIVLRAVKPGVARITVKANDGASPAVQHEITVVRPVSDIQLEFPTYQSWYNRESHGEPFNVNATVIPQDATNTGIDWYSTNTGVATVDNNGVVTPRGVGVSVIVASAKDGNGALGYAHIAVAEYPDAEGIVITDGESTTDAITYMGATLQMSGTIFPVTAQQDIEWSVVPGTGSATVSDTGLVTPTTAGTVTVRGTARSDATITADLQLEIMAAPTSATVTSGSVSLYPGRMTAMDIQIQPAGAYVPKITWHSANPSVATIDPRTGEITAVKYGSTMIYATVDTTVTERTNLVGIDETVNIPGGTTFDSNRMQIEVKASPTIRFNYNGGNEGIATKKVYQGQAYGELPTAVRANHEFLGWFTENGQEIKADSPCDRPDDFIVYAKWKALTFTVTFNLNAPAYEASIVGSPAITATINQGLGTLPSARRDYYTFKGWYDQSYDGNPVTQGTSYPEAKNVTVYAQWTENGFGEWIESRQKIEPNANREVAPPQYVDNRRTVYHYERWRVNTYSATYYDPPIGSSINLSGKWTTVKSVVYEPRDFDYPLTYVTNYGTHDEYKGEVWNHCSYWFHQQIQTVGEDYYIYRYRDRIKEVMTMLTQ